MSEAVRPELLVARLAAPEEPWRIEAEARLIQLGEAAVPMLVGATQHANPAVRIHSAHALARIGDPRGIAAIVRALGDEENNGAVAIAAEKALVEWGAPVKSALVEASKSGEERVRARAIRALGRLSGGDLVDPLSSLLRDPSASVRAQAAVALTQVAGRASFAQVLPLLADADARVRHGVAEALVKLGSTKGEAVLNQALGDPEDRHWAEELLDEISELRRTGAAID